MHSSGLAFSLFLLLTIASAIGVGYYYLRTNDKNPRKRIIYFSIMAISLLIGAFILIRCITFPDASSKVFNNPDYHVLEHSGFQFKNSFLLSNPDSVNALWVNEYSGRLTLTSEAKNIYLKGENFVGPVYLQNINSEEFELLNPYSSLDCSSGFVLEKYGIKRLELKIKKKFWRDEYVYSVCLYDSLQKPDSIFIIKKRQSLKKGYEIHQLLKLTEGLSLPADIDYVLQNSWLCRKTLGAPNSSLHFMPSDAFLNSKGFSLLGITDSSRNFNQILMPGDLFFQGVDDKKSDVIRIDSNAVISFRMPKCYRLKSDGQVGLPHTLLLTSKQSNFEQSSLKGGYFFNRFDEDSKNHIWAEIGYTEGASNQDLKFWTLDYHNNAEGGDTIKVSSNTTFQLKSENANLNWLMGINNLRTSFPISPFYIYLLCTVYWLLVFHLLNYIGFSKISAVEIVIYAVVFAFVVIRLLLNWRIGVFPPVENIEFGRWNALRSGKYFFGYTVLPLCLFLGLRFFISTDYPYLIYKRLESLWAKQQIKYQQKPFRFVEKILAYLYGGFQCKSLNSFFFFQLGILCLFSSILKFIAWVGLPTERFINIALPITVYFWLDYRQRVDAAAKELSFRLANSGLTFAYLLLKDAGFGVVFLLFQIVSEVVNRSYLLMFDKKDSKDKIQHKRMLIILSICFFLLTAFNTQLITYFFKIAELTPNIIFIVFFCCIFFILKYFYDEDRNLGNKWQLVSSKWKISERKQWSILAIMTLIITCLGAISINIPEQVVKKYGYIKYRAAIHTDAADKLLQNAEFASLGINQIRESAQNQWFINTYLHADRDQEEFYDNSILNLQPDFNQGVSYNTQTTDLVTTRYLIAEHSEWVAVLLVLLLSLTAVFCFASNKFNDEVYTFHSAIILLITTAIFVWLTATNRFTFFGQDFPFISVSSLLSVVLPLGILLAVISWSHENITLKIFSRSDLLKSAFPYLALLFVIFLAGHCQVRQVPDEYFNLSEAMNELNQLEGKLNEEFIEFQKDNTVNQDWRGKEEFLAVTIKQFLEKKLPDNSPNPLI
jgi:hypothetical protein